MLKRNNGCLKRKCEVLEAEVKDLETAEDLRKEKNAHISDDEDWLESEEEDEEAPNTDDENFIDDRDETEL